MQKILVFIYKTEKKSRLKLLETKFSPKSMSDGTLESCAVCEAMLCYVELFCIPYTSFINEMWAVAIVQ